MALDWRFPSNLNGDINGINDSGIETFADDSYYSLVRETIQNSLDVHNTSTTDPVIVEFKEFAILRNKIPGVDSLSESMKRCQESNKEEKAAKRFFDNALDVISKNEISVLKVSDYNTRGLEGSDTCKKGTSWSRLIKENGSSEKSDISGGSKGIGKNAAYACSDLRTVFYSSLDIAGLKSYFGVAKLISYQMDDTQWSQGHGYYSDDDSFTAIHECFSFDEDERKSPGTDIYIIGNRKELTLKTKIEESVLLDFFISILKGKLIVRVQNEEISKETIGSFISRLDASSDERKTDLLTYYHMMTGNDPNIIKISLNSEEYGKDYSFKDNDCTLYLYGAKDNLNRRILMTREKGMRLFEQKNIHGSINFTGILMITGNEMNRVFKEMEVPSHDSWKPTRNNNPKYYEDVYKELREYLRNKVKENFGISSKSTIDAFGVEDFLPDTLDTGESKELEGKVLSSKTRLGNKKTMKASTKRTKIKEQIKFDETAEGFGTGAAGFHPTPGPNQLPLFPNPGQQPGPEPTDIPIPNPQGEKSKDTYKQIEIQNSRLMCSNSSEGIYKYRFIVPNNAKNGRLEFFISGEQSEFELSVISVKRIKGSFDSLNCKDGKVYLANLKKGDEITLELKVDFDDYCMMEVDYYESKK